MDIYILYIYNIYMIDLRLLARLEMGYTPIIKTQVLQRLGATLMGRHRSRLDVT